MISGLLLIKALIEILSQGTILFTGCLHAGVQSAPMELVQEESLRGFLKDFVAKAPSEEHTSTRYVSAFVDLNGDGKKEAVVYLMGSRWCGSGGCPTLILAPEGKSHRLVAKITLTRPPIRVFKERSNGWRALGVWVQGGGVQIGYEAELHFDGNQYPSNPTIAPAHRVSQEAIGEEIIKAAEKGRLLYP